MGWSLGRTEISRRFHCKDGIGTLALTEAEHHTWPFTTSKLRSSRAPSTGPALWDNLWTEQSGRPDCSLQPGHKRQWFQGTGFHIWCFWSQKLMRGLNYWKSKADSSFVYSRGVPPSLPTTALACSALSRWPRCCSSTSTPYPWAGWQGVMPPAKTAACLRAAGLARCPGQPRHARTPPRHGAPRRERSGQAELCRRGKCSHYSCSGQPKCLHHSRVGPWSVEENMYLCCLLSRRAALHHVQCHWIKCACTWPV